jgi:hypothetical protein
MRIGWAAGLRRGVVGGNSWTRGAEYCGCVAYKPRGLIDSLTCGVASHVSWRGDVVRKWARGGAWRRRDPTALMGVAGWL